MTDVQDEGGVQDNQPTQPVQPVPEQPTQPVPEQPAQASEPTAQEAAPQQAYAQQPTAQQPYAQPYAQPSYTQPSYVQPTYSQPAYGVPPQPPYPQNSYASQTTYEQPSAAATQAATKKKKQKQPKPPKAPREKKATGGVRTFLCGFAGAAVACVIALGGFALYQTLGDTTDASSDDASSSSTSTTISVESEDTTLAEAVAEKCLPSVCSIDVYTAESTYSYGYGYDSSSSDESSLTQSSLGSGVVLTEDGYIITNYHVIEDSDALEVTIDGTTYEAEVVGYDSSSDVAVIKAVDASGLTPIEIGDSDDLTVGEWVMSIGSPFGLEQSVATGVVSATSRSQILDSSTDSYGNSTGEYTIYPNMIQTDAAINPGNSGGALVNSEGQIIGINTLITSYSGNYSGVGFAIPINYAYSIAEQIMNGETPTHAQLGVSMTSVTSTMADRYGLGVDSGAYVSAVSSGSGAEEAGIQVGDIITAFDGETVESASDLMIDVRTKSPGDVVTVEVYRDGETLELEVTLGEDSTSTSSSEESSDSSAEDMLNNLFNQQNNSSDDEA